MSTSRRIALGLLATALCGLLASGCRSAQPAPWPSATATAPPKTGDASAKDQAGSLTIHAASQTRQLSRQELWNHPRAFDLTIVDQATHSGQRMTYRAIPMPALFEGITVRPGETLEFDTFDGFSASLDPAQVFNQDDSLATAYLAIEDPGNPWPKLRDGKSTAGPLYLVWKNPERSGIGQEQWPYQIRSFSVKGSVQSRFPALTPEPGLAEDHPAVRGYRVFIKNCFACHTFNGQGTSRLGPDLNQPHSPVEYMDEAYLRKLVRDPQSVRSWKGSRMSSFSLEALPESDLDDLVAYLRHKAEHRGDP